MKKSNFADILVLLLKAQILDKGVRQVRLTQAEVMRAENFDLKIERSKLAGGDLVLTLAEAPPEDNEAKIILPDGSNPFVGVKGRRRR